MTIQMSEIWEEFSLPLKIFIKKRIPNDPDVDDVLQEVFLKILKNAEGLRDDNKIHAWVYRITRNAIADYYRTKETLEVAELPDNLAEESEEEATLNAEIESCLKVMMKELPEKYKEALLLTEFENLTQKEFGERMGLSLSGAKSRVQRARKKLKGMLLACCHLQFDRAGNIIDYEHRSSECVYCG